jgi:pyruvate formate lyase activating enzyme
MSVSPDVAAVAAAEPAPDPVAGPVAEPGAGPVAEPGAGPVIQPSGVPAAECVPGPVESGPVTDPVTGLIAGRVAFSTVDGPGRRYVLRLQGCTFDCLACPHPAMLARCPAGMAPRTVDEVAAEIAEDAPYLTGVTVSGGEPTLQADFVHALLCRLATRRGTRRLTRFVESNGDADPAVWQLLAPVTDGFMVDLKALDDETHVVLTGRSNVRVLESIRTLSGMGLLYEVRLLPIPGINDSDEQLEAIAAWLLSVDPWIRVRVNEFHRLGTRETARDLLRPRRVEMVRYRHVLSRVGITDLVVP